jgi:hypothetical protein
MTGEDFKRWMARRGWTHRIAALEFGVDIRTVARWRSARVVPKRAMRQIDLLERQGVLL